MSAQNRMTAVLRTASAMVGRYEDALRHRRAARTLHGLPDHILKDIGYGRDAAGIPTRVWNDLSR